MILINEWEKKCQQNSVLCQVLCARIGYKLDRFGVKGLGEVPDMFEFKVRVEL